MTPSTPKPVRPLPILSPEQAAKQARKPRDWGYWLVEGAWWIGMTCASVAIVYAAGGMG